MKNRLLLMAALVMLVAMGAVATANRPGPTPAKKAPAKKRLLVVTHTAGFRHEEAIRIGEPVVKELGEKSGAFEVDYCRTEEEVRRTFTPEGLKPYDGVFFLNTTTNAQRNSLGIADLKWFLDWLKSGKAFIGAHAAADTYKSGDLKGDLSFVEMIGGEFRTHGAQCEVEAKVEDPSHPAVAHLGSTFKIFDEIYLFNHNDRSKLHVLLSLDKHPNDGSPDANKPGDYLVSWCKMYGKGRVFYTSLGHRGDVWQNPAYQQHLLGGIRWALGLAKGKAKP